MKPTIARRIGLLLCVCSGLVAPVGVRAGDHDDTNTFLVATYNLRNWLSMTRWDRPNQPKPHREKSAVVNYLAGIRPQVLALQEVGDRGDFAEIMDLLRRQGLVYPDHHWVEGADTNRHVAILSQFPIIARDSITDARYSLGQHQVTMSRGVLDVTIRVNEGYRFRALVVHLKSKRPVPDMSQAAMRLEEARLVRRHAVGLLRANPGRNLLLMGDLNDEPDSPALQAVRGREPPLLYPLAAVDRRGRAFTHFWATGGRRSQIDYLLVNEAMRAEVVSGGTGVADADGWNDASDHRAVYARFHAVDREPAISYLVPGEAEDAAPPTQVPTQSGWFWVASLGGVTVVILVARRLGWCRRAS